jgi:endonuclease/exonuclease/phosphatase family metal-dependent hydrolase
MKKILRTILRWLGILLLIMVFAVVGFLWLGNYHPSRVEAMSVICPNSSPMLKSGQSITALTWNVQTMSGKNYVFWSDLPNNDGPDEKPSKEDISQTFEEVVRVIQDVNPDIIMIQEIDHGAERTSYEDQLARLAGLLPEYPCSTSAFDWKSAYVPHPRIHGSVGWKVAILSKYQISNAERIQLTTARKSFIEDQFKIKPAILKAMMPISGGGEFAALTLHLDLYVPGTNAKEIQLVEVEKTLQELSSAKTLWILGGDFNLLPPDAVAFNRLPPAQQQYYNPNSEIKYLTDRFVVLPTVQDVTGPEFAKWFTRWPNDPSIPGPDRTLDYFFISDQLQISDHYVRQEDTLRISDHFPVVSVAHLP